uniref:Phosphatidylinositol N-acetylglucosaminyltransferase subunit C n=1 Tax=Haemonchus contortus TaxID=6289 RepID=A0A7I4XT51_HAECO|nr:Phosphatidylinositol N-acetylglucosaminyltransferase domain containing protein [Haemonchus contortus]
MASGDAVWEKILYRRQPYPDNYSGGDEQFLCELKKNLSAVKYTYWEAVFGVERLVFHLNLIVLLYIIFEYVFNNTLDATVLATGLIATSLLLYVVYALVLAESKINFIDHLYTVVVLFLFGYATTPAIRTLTSTISTDTIFALSFITALISCVFHDYGINAPIVSYQLSVSSGLSSAVFLLSRLESNDLAFVMLSMTFALHAFSPFIRNILFANYAVIATVLTISLSIFSTYMLWTLYVELSVMWTLFQLFLLFVCPFILIVKQKSKQTIHGPWDEAILRQNPY